MVSSTDAMGSADASDGLELVTGAPPEPSVETGPELHTLIIGEPEEAVQAAVPEEPAVQLPREDVYLGDGDEIDLIDGVDPQPVYEPALIDLDDESFGVDLIEADAPDAAVDVVEVADTLMAVDDYGDVL